MIDTSLKEVCHINLYFKIYITLFLLWCCLYQTFYHQLGFVARTAYNKSYPGMDVKKRFWMVEKPYKPNKNIKKIFFLRPVFAGKAE